MTGADQPDGAGTALSLRDWVGLAAAFSLLGGLLYSPALFSWYASDDFLHFARVIEGGLPFWPGPDGGGFLRPLVGLSFWLDYQLWGLNPLPAHLVNIALHVANSLLVVKLALVVQGGQVRASRFGPMAAGIVFLVLGCHAEAVSWIACRGDLLGTFFILLMMLSFLSGARVFSLSCLGLALLSKESAFSAPLLLMLCLMLRRSRSTKDTLERGEVTALLSHILVVVPYFIFRRAMLGSFVGGYGAHGHLRAQPDLVAQSLGHFVWRVLLPPLPDRLLGAMPALQGTLAMTWLACILATLLVLIWRAWRRPTAGVLCAIAFFAALVPVFNVRIYLSEIEGERYLYLPSVFAAMGLGLGLARLFDRRTRMVLLVAVALFQSAVLFSGVLYWRGAATIARVIVAGIQEQHKGGTILLVNKPDTFGGALVFRTGLPEALEHFGPHPIDTPMAEALFATGMYRRNHGFAFGPALEGPPGAMELRSLYSGSGFSEDDRENRIKVLNKASDSAVFVFREPLRDVEVFYYDAGGVKAVNFPELTSKAPSAP